MKSPNGVRISFKLIGLIIGVALYAITFVAMLIHVSISYLAPPPANRELIALSKPTEIQAEFINKISKDIKLKKDIRLLLGPYAPIGKGRLLESPLSWFILVDEKFFIGLPDMEQKALIGHEMGHIVFTPSVCGGVIECQEDADFFAAVYTSPETVIILLDKFFIDPRDRNSEQFKLRLENMEKLKQQSLQKH